MPHEPVVCLGHTTRSQQISTLSCGQMRLWNVQPYITWASIFETGHRHSSDVTTTHTHWHHSNGYKTHANVLTSTLKGFFVSLCNISKRDMLTQVLSLLLVSSYLCVICVLSVLNPITNWVYANYSESSATWMQLEDYTCLVATLPLVAITFMTQM